jgi:hypothetical protein
LLATYRQLVVISRLQHNKQKERRYTAKIKGLMKANSQEFMRAWESPVHAFKAPPGTHDQTGMHATTDGEGFDV